jgi:ATP-dependent Clp protease, protease subunit
MEDLLFAMNAETDDIYQQVIKEYYNDRKIVFNQEIDDNLVENMVLMILQWNKADKDLPIDKRKKIYIYLNSDGGDIVAGNLALSAIKLSKTPVVTVGLAKCASMASYILAAGHERYCFPNTIVLYHDGQTGYVSSGNKGKDIQKFYDELDKYNADFMINNTNMTAEFLEKIKDREYYMFPEEAKELGIVEKIIGVDCDIDEII